LISKIRFERCGRRELIKVLQNWQEIGDSILTLQRGGLPTHGTSQKNWDHFLLYESLASTPKGAMIADLGCGDGHTLSLLHALGFQNVHGVDHKIGWRVRAKQLIAMKREKSLRPPFYLHRDDITKTPFAGETCDIAVSISTLEHGVDLERFFAEAGRILKPGGALFITTDYWDKEIKTNGSARAFGLPWKIFSYDQIESLIQIAGNHGFNLTQECSVPSCGDKPVSWQGEGYTFIAIQLKKAD
jgi:SAM-dependent methyltransferase